MQGLIVHSGGQLVTLEELRALPAPESKGRFHAPVPHHTFIEAILGQLGRFGLEVAESQFAVARAGAHFFGVLQFTEETKAKVTTKCMSAMGVRSSTDESFAMAGCAGARVTVCDNLLFSGEEFVFSRKHTLHVNLSVVVEKGINRYIGQKEAMEFEMSRLATVDITDKEAETVFGDLLRREVLPDRYIGKACRSYFKPEGEDTEPRSLWGLHNAVTRNLRETSMVTKMQHTQALSRYLATVA